MPRQGHNTPVPLERQPPASFKRLLGSDERHTSTDDAPRNEHEPNSQNAAPQRHPRDGFLGLKPPLATKALALALAEHANSPVHRYCGDREARERRRKARSVREVAESGQQQRERRKQRAVRHKDHGPAPAVNDREHESGTTECTDCHGAWESWIEQELGRHG